MININEMSLEELNAYLERIWGAENYYESASYMSAKDYECVDALKKEETLVTKRIKEMETGRNDTL